MSKFNPLFYFTGIFFIIACGGQNDKPSASAFTMDNFKGIPEEVQGCSCYFSETELKFKNSEYLFTAGFDSTGFVSVNNKLVKLKLISTGRDPQTFGDYDHTDIYTSEHYKVTVDIKYRNSNGYETWWNDGTITLESKNGQKLVKKFVGECGC